MAAVGRRRTPGLRREEIAVLAGVGVSWYTWLEQCREVNVSAEVLDAIGRALRLTEPERAHLYPLAGLNPPRARRDARRRGTWFSTTLDPGRDTSRLDAAVDELDGGSRVLAMRGDVASLADLDTVAAAIRDRHGRLDVVFANAGVAGVQPNADIAEAEFDRVVGTNLKGVFFTIQKTVPLLSDHAAIVINASWALHRGLPGASLYAATKAAVHNLARTLAAELAPRGIPVNSVSPGYIEPPMFHDEISAEAQAVVAQVPAGRLGTADDVADAVAFLASSEASYVNGQDLIIDGGLLAAARGSTG